MARPIKYRIVCNMPNIIRFIPEGSNRSINEEIVMTVDEYETIRLIDYEGLTQEECANFMQVARTTVQQIYTDARKKLSSLLVEGRPLFINGGHYQISNKNVNINPRGRGHCHRNRNSF